MNESGQISVTELCLVIITIVFVAWALGYVR